MQPINFSSLVTLIPEIFLAGMSLLTLILSVFLPRQKYLPYCLAQITMIVTAILTWVVADHLDLSQPLILFHQSFILDHLAVYLKTFIYLSVFVTFFYIRAYNIEKAFPQVEFYVLALLATLGMMVIVSAHNFLVMFLGIELSALPIYALIAMQRKESLCVEAAMKYFIIGAAASGILLYGISMIFGATQSINFSVISSSIAMSGTSYLIAVLGLIFIIVGIAFKLGAAPFHMWVPDVYNGAPVSVTLFISTAPKIAAYAIFIRILGEAMTSLSVEWHQILILIAIVSLAVGNFAAIMQSNLKRLLAYSSIAHMGYLLLGIACTTPRGYAASMFYVITYSITTLGTFGFLVALNRSGVRIETIKDLASLNNRNPILAFFLLMMMFSLAGIPPLVGFIAKVGILEALIKADLVWVAVVAVLFAVVGAYYYIRVVKIMYFEKTHAEQIPFTCSKEMSIAIGINAVVVLLLGIFPGWLYTLAHWSF